MQKKTGTTVVTDATAQAALRRGATPRLAPDEERAARMRLGAPPPRATPLERKVLAGSDAEIELLAYEIEGFLRWKEHLAAVRAAPPAVATASRTKDKIVRALRRKN